MEVIGSMRVFAYCSREAAGAVIRATGVFPYVAPPMTCSGFDPCWLQQRDLIYIRLHGMREINGTWFGRSWDGALWPAFDASCIPDDLGGAVVVIATCFGDRSILVPEFYRAGASAVIAGAGLNFAAKQRVIGVDLLVQWMLRGLAVGLSAERSLDLAKARLVLTAFRRADRDALEFRKIAKEA